MPLFGHKEPTHAPVHHAPPPTTHKTGLFSSHKDPAPVPVQHQPTTTHKTGGLFGHKSQPAPAPVTTRRSADLSPNTRKSGGLFSRRRSSSFSSVSSDDHKHNSGGILHRNSKHTSSSGGGLLSRSRHPEDPSIVAARQRVHAAEEAERQADRALIASRNAVREAREHVLRLEREAAEEARLAKIKQHQAGQIGKSAKGLGRHG